MKSRHYLSIAAALAFAQTGMAQSTWNTNSGSWNTSGNWSSGIPDSSTATADFVRDFTAAPTITLDNASGFTINRLNFDDTGSSGDVSMTINAGTPSGGLIIFAGTTPTIDVRATTLTINPGGTLGTGFSRIGSGALVFGGAATFGGTATFSGSGTTSFNGPLTGWSNSIVNTVTAGTVVLGTGSGQTFTWAGVSKTAGAGTVQYNSVDAGEFTLPSSYSVGAGGITLNAAGTYDGTAGFTKAGAGTLTIGSAATNAAGTYNVTGTLAFNGIVAGSTGLTKTGAGTLIFNNSANTITGTITLGAGIQQIRDGSTNNPAVFNNLTGKSITVQNTATLDLPRLHSSTAQDVTWTLPALTLESGSTLRFRASTGTSNHTLAAAISTAGTTTINNNGGAFGHDIALTGILSGSGTINYLASTNSGSSTAAVRTLTLNNTSTSFSGNWFVDYTVTSTDDFVALRSGAAGALGTGTVTLDRRARLINNAANGINSLAGVTLNQSTSSLVLNSTNVWSNTAATLTANNGTIELGTGASSIGTFVLNSSGTVTLNAGSGGSLTVGTALDIRQGTLTGTGGLTSSLDLVKTTTGTAIIDTNNSLTGGTTITEGTLQVGNGGTTGTIGSGNITNDGTLILNRSDAQSWGQQISGSGSFTIRGGTALTLTNTQSYTGTTRIEGGSSLTLSGTGGDRLATTSSLAFAGTSSLDLGTNNQTVAALALPVANADSSTTITGTGTLTINGAAPFNFGVSGSIGTSIRTAAVEMTGLAGFTFNSPTQVFRVGAQPGLTSSTGGRPDSSFLASNNTSITALSFLLADQAGSGTGGNNTFRLGESTSINANTINIGASGRSNATLNFNTGLTAPKVTLRATNGTSRVTNWEVGRVAHFSNVTWTAIADFSGGEIDALVNNLRVGIINTTNQVNRQGVQNSTFTMGKGVLDVTNLVLGEQSGSYTNNLAGGTYAANGTFTLNHADGLLVANSIRLAENTGDLTGGTRSISGTLNLQAGTIEAAEIRLGAQTATSPAAITRNFNFSGGTVRNLTGSDLTITNVPINLTGSGIFSASAGRTIAAATDTPLSGTGGLTKTGAGTLILAGTNNYSGATLLNEGTLGGTGSASSILTAITGTTVAPGTSIGTMATAGLNLPAGATLAIEINSTTDTADLLTAAGPVDITGSTVSFTEIGSGTIPAGTKLVILDYTGHSLTGTFNGLAEGATVNVGANSFTLSYIDSSRITLTSTTVGDAYDTWAGSKGLDGSPGKEAGFHDDPDGDGVENGLEWILGGEPLDGKSGDLVDVTGDATSGLTLNFTRNEDSIGLATLVVEYNGTLANPWNNATVGAATTGPDANGVTVTIDTLPNPDDVTINIPASNAVDGKLFGRLKAEK